MTIDMRWMPNILKDVFFCYMESEAKSKLAERLKCDSPSQKDIDGLRDWCISGLHEYVEAKIEEYVSCCERMEEMKKVLLVVDESKTEVEK